MIGLLAEAGLRLIALGAVGTLIGCLVVTPRRFGAAVGSRTERDR